MTIWTLEIARLKLNCGCKCGNQTKAGKFNHERPPKKESGRLPPACRPLSRSRPHGLHRATEGRPAVKGANLELSSRSDRASCDSPSQAQNAPADTQSRKQLIVKSPAPPTGTAGRTGPPAAAQFGTFQIFGWLLRCPSDSKCGNQTITS